MLIFQNLLRRTRRDQAAVTQYIGAAADTEGLADVVVRDEDADAALTQVANDALDVEHRDRVDAGEGFVEQDEQRVGGQRPGDLDAASLAA